MMRTSVLSGNVFGCRGHRARQHTLHPRGGTQPTTHSRALSASAVGNARHSPTPGNQRNHQRTSPRVHPFHVSDHRSAFPVAEVAEAHLRIFPDRAGIEPDIIRRDLTVDPHLVVPTQFVFDVRYQTVS